MFCGRDVVNNAHKNKQSPRKESPQTRILISPTKFKSNSRVIKVYRALLNRRFNITYGIIHRENLASLVSMAKIDSFRKIFRMVVLVSLNIQSSEKLVNMGLRC
jgi:hypothetical protein